MSLKLKLKAAKKASLLMRNISSEKKIELINSIADHVSKASLEICSINQTECILAKEKGLTDSQIDRLMLDQSRIDAMVDAARNVAMLPDCIGEELDSFLGENDISIKKVRVPLGVVAVIYENRPNVTLDAASIAIKSSNAIVLRGSSTAHKTNTAIVKAIKEGIDAVGLDSNIVSFLEDPSHEEAIELMKAKDYVDVLIPRGGPALISSIEQNATVPFVIDGAGNCHVYVDEFADLEMALKIVMNSKIQRTSVCNTAESLVVNEKIAEEFLQTVSKQLVDSSVIIHGDSRTLEILPANGNIILANEEDFAKEYLGLEISIAVVGSIEKAIEHINKYSTGHSESIVTSNSGNAKIFFNNIDSAVVYQNTSTRFTDGERFGFGAEIGISTQKLHARGPMALKELTTYQYRVVSDGKTV